MLDQLVPDNELTEWRRKKTASLDLRLLGYYPALGSEKRFISFEAAAQKYAHATDNLPGWPIKGKRISLETIQSLLSAATSLPRASSDS